MRFPLNDTSDELQMCWFELVFNEASLNINQISGYFIKRYYVFSRTVNIYFGHSGEAEVTASHPLLLKIFSTVVALFILNSNV